MFGKQMFPIQKQWNKERSLIKHALLCPTLSTISCLQFNIVVYGANSFTGACPLNKFFYTVVRVRSQFLPESSGLDCFQLSTICIPMQGGLPLALIGTMRKPWLGSSIMFPFHKSTQSFKVHQGHRIFFHFLKVLFCQELIPKDVFNISKTQRFY